MTTSTQEAQLRVGNDVVDLTVTESKEVLSRKSFLNRVFSPDELDLIRQSHTPVATLWKLWACKESAYKALASSLPGIPFHWSAYRVSRDLQTVRYLDHTLSASVIEFQDSVVALVSGMYMEGGALFIDDRFNASSLKKHLLKVEMLDTLSEYANSVPESALVRRQLIALGTELTGIPPANLSIRESGQRGSGVGPALILPDGSCVQASLSHHGRFFSSALAYLNMP